MGKRMLFLCVLTITACGPQPLNGEEGEGCGLELSRCNGNTFQICENGSFLDDEICEISCDSEYGCTECDPGAGNICVGNSVYGCNGDGELGQLVEHCELLTCNKGRCSDDCANAGAKLIYVVDKSYRLYSFDPTITEFSSIGNISCPAGYSWPEWGGGASTPFSMSVDRSSKAWVLFTSGEIFSVSTENASCEATNFVAGQAGFKLFGLGFVSNSEGSAAETLFIAGGSVNTFSANLGKIDSSSLSVSNVGSLPAVEYPPELTGTGNGELYGYYPGTTVSKIAKINKASGEWIHSWDLPALPGTVSGWAFAHWGGVFYIFVTTTNGLDQNSQLYVFEPVSQSYTQVLNNIGFKIVGAGVSTCAPVIIN